MPDKETLDAYNSNVAAYAEMVSTEKPGQLLQNFMNELPEKSHILDLGCGTANSSVILKRHGHNPDPVDASEEMVRYANDNYNLGARVATFDELDAVKEYDGVWANFSLLHAPRDDLPRHLKQIHTALKDEGIFHIAMKTGSDAARDRLGRHYTYYAHEELVGYVKNAGFEIISETTGEEKGLAGDIDTWLALLSRKRTNALGMKSDDRK